MNKNKEFWFCSKHGVICREEDRWGLVLHRRKHDESLRDFKLMTEEQIDKLALNEEIDLKCI